MGTLPLLALFFAVLTSTFNLGFFSFSSLLYLLTWLGCLWVLFTRARTTPATTKDVPALAMTTVVIYAIYLAFPYGIYHTTPSAAMAILLCSVFLFPVILTYLLPDTNRHIATLTRFRYIGILLVALGIRLLILRASPAPVIDVFTFLKEAPLALLSGENPYAATFTPVYAGITNNYYTYWPASILLQLPFVWLFSDPRVLLVMADIVSAVLLFLLGRKSRTAELISILYLFRPNANFILEQSWLAALEVCCFLAFLFFRRVRKPLLAGILFAILVGIKQQYVILLPIFLLFAPLWRRTLFSFICTILLIVLPFFLWNPAAFYEDTVGFLARDPRTITNPPIMLALTLNTALFRLTSFMFPHLLMISTSLLTCFFLLWYIAVPLRHTGRVTLSRRVLASVIMLLTLYLWNAYAFINYYYSVLGVYLAALVLPLDREQT